MIVIVFSDGVSDDESEAYAGPGAEILKELREADADLVILQYCFEILSLKC